MEGGRERFHCPSCGRGFNFWVQTITAQPKVKCYYCGKDYFPKGEPPAPPPAPPKPQPAAAPPAPAPVVN